MSPVAQIGLGRRGPQVSVMGLGCMSMSVAATWRPRSCQPCARWGTASWPTAQGDDIVSIPGTKRRARLEENLAALEIELTAGDLARIDAAMPPGSAAGARYPEAAMGHIEEA
jgi:aryl-alcohol dehydrogenase-like predicted oxidoreductase